nr:hypothetical protein [Variovorax boronicumulans]
MPPRWIASATLAALRERYGNATRARLCSAAIEKERTEAQWELCASAEERQQRMQAARNERQRVAGTAQHSPLNPHDHRLLDRLARRATVPAALGALFAVRLHAPGRPQGRAGGLALSLAPPGHCRADRF